MVEKITSIKCPVHEDYHEHRNEFCGALEKIEEMHNAMEELKHLQTLPVIADSLKNLNENIIGPAMGKKVVPQAAYFTTLVIMSMIIAVLLLKDTNKSLHIDSGGFHMGELEPGAHDASATQ